MLKYVKRLTGSKTFNTFVSNTDHATIINISPLYFETPLGRGYLCIGGFYFLTMKTIKLIIALSLFAFVGKSQCTITASPDLNVCLDDVVTITANGATEYTFVAGPATNYNTSGNFTNSFKWNTIVYISGKVGGCVATATVNITTSACTGINELGHTEEKAIYYDLQGNVIQPRYNEVIIKQVGSVRKKVVITDTP